MDRNYTFILRRPGVAIVPDIKIVTMLVKTIIKDSEKLKELESKICWFLVKKCWCQQNSRGLSRDLYIFWIFLVCQIPSL